MLAGSAPGEPEDGPRRAFRVDRGDGPDPRDGAGRGRTAQGVREGVARREGPHGYRDDRRPEGHRQRDARPEARPLSRRHQTSLKRTGIPNLELGYSPSSTLSTFSARRP